LVRRRAGADRHTRRQRKTPAYAQQEVQLVVVRIATRSAHSLTAGHQPQFRETRELIAEGQDSDASAAETPEIGVHIAERRRIGLAAEACHCCFPPEVAVQLLTAEYL